MKKIIVLLVGMLFCVTSLSYAQNINWNLTGAGARAAGFGGAFIGVADDATAISWNPAGLTQLIDPEASAVMRYITDSYKFDYFDRPETESMDHFVLNFASAVYPFNIPGIKLVAAAAFQQQLDLYSKWEFDEERDESTGGASNISLGLAAELFPVLSLGVSSNIWTGSLSYVYEEYDGYDWIPTDEYDENYSGFNFNVGLMLNLTNLNNPIPLKIGADFKSPFILEGDIDGEFESFPYKASREFEMPTMIGVGASVLLGDNLTVSIDYETRAYKEKKISLYDEDGNLVEQDYLSEYNLNQLRIGAEYLLVTDFAVIPVRAGFHTLPTTFSNYYDSGDTDQVVGSGFAVGTGLIFEKFALDATATIDSYKIEDPIGYVEVTSTIFTLSGIIYLN